MNMFTQTPTWCNLYFNISIRVLL